MCLLIFQAHIALQFAQQLAARHLPFFFDFLANFFIIKNKESYLILFFVYHWKAILKETELFISLTSAKLSFDFAHNSCWKIIIHLLIIWIVVLNSLNVEFLL
jgi:hypothetical protein